MAFSTRTNRKQFKDLPEELREALFADAPQFEIIPRELAEELQAFVVENTEDSVTIAAVDPTDTALRKFVKQRIEKPVTWLTATREDVSRVLTESTQDIREEISRLITRYTQGDTGKIASAVDRLISFALEKQASDIHIEATSEDTAVRFRLDGILHQVLTIPQDAHDAVIARLKLLADLRIDETRRPQEGRIVGPQFPDVSLRISTMPTLHGEKAALRVMDDSHKDFTLSRLGFSKTHEETILRNLKKPFGMILTSGPTGSGKTTTLYGLLGCLERKDMNISTLEDPIEYGLSFVNQIQINPHLDLTFSSGLRSLLRQDPDVIMVGEIRDTDTATMAADAALTGHVVLSTLHTNDAPSALTRLVEMGVQEFMVASTVNLVISQRLVRKICKQCVHEEKLEPIVLQKLKERQDIITVLTDAGVTPEVLEQGTFRKGKGCSACLDTGYAGRVGIFEILEMDKPVHDAFLTQQSADHIARAASKQGFQSMLHDGLEKVDQGITTFEEILRVTKSN